MPNEDQRSKYPCVIALILLIGFSEKFCFFSYRTILKEFLQLKLGFDEGVAVSILRYFKILSYFTPLLGGIIADMWLGCFWTIFFASILHALGNSLVSLSTLILSWKLVKYSTLFGLFTFAIGTGGLQPCVLSLGGDQFQNNQVRGREQKNHWLDHADDKYDEALILDIKSFIGIIWIYLPLPFFWTLYEKQSSVWMQQAEEMSQQFRELRPPPLLIQIINLVLVAILIPVFDCILYPCLSKFGLCRTDLQKMTVGGCLSSIAFIMAGFTQMYIDTTSYSGFQNLGDIVVINNCPCEIIGEDKEIYSLKNFGGSFQMNSHSGMSDEWFIKPTNCGAFNIPPIFKIKMVTLSSDKLYEGEESVSSRPSDDKASVTMHFNSTFLKKDFSFDFHYVKTIHVVRSKELNRPFKVIKIDYNSVPLSMRNLFFILNDNRDDEQSNKCEKVPKGATYIAAYNQNSNKCHGFFSSFLFYRKLQISILYQIPQIVFLSCGEVMFSVTGLKFTYSQAPSSLKSVVQAIWLVTNGIGNVIVIILDEAMEIHDQSNQYFVYAAIMFMSMMVFACLGHLYIYVDRE
ncbi:solute carrier family 15 member 2 [Trichonephila inaurata madagascariensis]|uniref:Solute carrier family 15 member 2 n=1 Tax=Trichonephila inaurata madagascariensis TaxID=2747483 RepID=A0A8X6YDY6_9ARAC|nr:solute carrier family 15 member 2 [Trichonephila inaurata madagascariensis]